MLKYTANQAAGLIANWKSFGESQTAMRNAAGANPIVGNASTLPRDVWQRFETEAVELQRPILAVFNDLALTLSEPIDIGETVNNFLTVSDSGEVNTSLDGRSDAKGDQAQFEYHGTPVPIIDTLFTFGWRQMKAAESKGFQLDAASRNNATRRIAEKMESIALIGDAKIKVQGNQLYGITNHPKRSTRTTGQTLNGATGAQWLADVVATVKLLHNKNFFVAPTLYLNYNDWFYASVTDFSTQYPNKTILQRLQEIGIASVVPSSSVVAGDLIMVVKSKEVIQVLSGMPPSTIAKFRANVMDDYQFTRMAAAAVEIRFDADNNCGIAHSSLA
jgi:uncharacterized linocin/CFP29 family protein